MDHGPGPKISYQRIIIMILIDLNQVIISGVMGQIAFQKNNNIEDSDLRPMVLNVLRGLIVKFREKYGQPILCSDSRDFWRRDFFPQYKAHRKKARDNSVLDWTLIFNFLNGFKSDLKNFFPYKFIELDRIEADDIIGTLVPRHIQFENIMIVSKDGDFLQLQKYNKNSNYHVAQYDSTQKKLLVSKDPHHDLKLKLIEGDSGDGIPNILSPGNSFVEGIRQKSLTKDKKAKLLLEDLENHEDENIRERYIRNRHLIDLSYIPTVIKDEIINTFESTVPVSRKHLMQYFIDNRLKNLMSVLGDF